jgi:hypothetical protein
MKKLLTGSIMFVLALGFVAGAVLIPAEQATAAYCVYEDNPFIYYKGTCVPKEPLPDTEYIRMYQCLGYYYNTNTPCKCTYLDCVENPYKHPAQKPDL